MKKYLFGLLAITLAVGFSAFTTKKSAHKPLNPVTYYYISGTTDQRLAPGFTGQTPVTENSITATNFKAKTNWQSTSVFFNSGTGYIGSIQFNKEASDLDEDGGSDNELTLKEALTAVWNDYVAPNPDAMANSVTVNGVAVVTINKADAVH